MPIYENVKKVDKEAPESYWRPDAKKAHASVQFEKQLLGKLADIKSMQDSRLSQTNISKHRTEVSVADKTSI